MASQSLLSERENLQNPNLVIYLLNCAKNKACTITTIQRFADDLNCIAFLLQEPWCENSELPPIHRSFDGFAPTVKKQGAVTYISRNRGIETTVIFTYAHSFIGTTLVPGLPSFTLYNMYSPGHPKHLEKLVESLKPKPSSIFMGDLNAYHEWWQGSYVGPKRSRLSQIQRLKNPSIAIAKLV
jgi:hypothetical protein